LTIAFPLAAEAASAWAAANDAVPARIITAALLCKNLMMLPVIV